MEGVIMVKPYKLIVLVISFLCITIQSQTLITNVFKPYQLYVINEQQFIIFDNSSGLLYFDKKNINPIKIGSFGQGPGEYAKNSKIFIYKSNIGVSTRGKLILFNKNGNIVKEIRHNLRLNKNKLEILNRGNRYLIDLAETRFDRNGGTFKRTYITNFKFDKKKLLYEFKIPLPNKEVPLFRYYIASKTLANKIFISCAEDNGSIIIYNDKGIKENQILFTKDSFLKPSKEIISKRMSLYKKKAGDESFWKEIEKRITIPTYLPCIKDYFVTKDKIFVKTYEMVGNKCKFIVFNHKGMKLGSVCYPDAGDLYFILNKNYYYLEEDDNEEYWLRKI